MRHQAQNIEVFGIHPGNGVDRAVRAALFDIAAYIAIAECNPALALDPRKSFSVGQVIAVTMRDRNFDHLPSCVTAGERRVVTLHPQMLCATDKSEMRVAKQNAGQK